MENLLFEGTEKKLEMILAAPVPAIRHNRDGQWNRVVDVSGASILNHVKTIRMDAYLLSESSLFVWDDRIMMLTCGRTTLVQSVPEILKIIDQENITGMFYEQKNCIFPDDQPACFEEDAEYLKQFMPGQCCRIGDPGGNHLNIFASRTKEEKIVSKGVTFQLLMHDMAPDVMGLFKKHEGNTAGRITGACGFDTLYPFSMTLDDYLFDPQGYSVNAVHDSLYFTVHVTPQPVGSYASFETNIPETDFSRVAGQVLAVFRPACFSIILTTGPDAPHECLWAGMERDTGCCLTHQTRHDLDCGLRMILFNFHKPLRAAA